MKPEADHKSQLIHVLHMAYSGEKAAAYAYNAHWKSLKNPTERESIKRIENEELEHRAIVGMMLKKLGDGPQPWRELMMACIGRTVGVACFVIGWFLPMYFAGRLESSNIKEYDVAAGHAEALGMPDDARELLRLSAVEAQHEEFFLQTIANHPLLPLMGRIFGWGRRPVGALPADSRATGAVPVPLEPLPPGAQSCLNVEDSQFLG